jgi:5-hydroxyisourate hydrolase
MNTNDQNITTHVLDTSSGRPASGLKLSIFSCSNPTVEPENDYVWQKLLETVTDENGRAKLCFNIMVGIYKIVFYTQTYFQKNGTPNFYPKVEIIFRILDLTTHYHVPLILSPYGYSTYRGS